MYADRFNEAILRFQQSGLVDKFMDDILWNLQKTSSDRLLKISGKRKLKDASQDERGLTTADTEGMFLLMGIGYLIGASVFISEAVGGCAKKCREIARRGSMALSLRSSAGNPNSSRKTSVSAVGVHQYFNENDCVDEEEEEADDVLSNDEKQFTENIKHRRHNSLVLCTFSDDKNKMKELLNLKRSADDEPIEISNDANEIFKINETHQAEINWKPNLVNLESTPTTDGGIDECFGEKINN